MKTILTKPHELFFNSELNKILGSTQKKYPAEKHLSEEPKKVTNIAKIHLKCKYVDESIVKGRCESILFSSSLRAPPGVKILKIPYQNCFRK